VPGTADRPGEVIKPGHRRGGFVGGEALAGDGHGAGLVEVGGDAAFADRGPVAPGGPAGVVFEDHPA
jgi:hypothetical protein